MASRRPDSRRPASQKRRAGGPGRRDDLALGSGRRVAGPKREQAAPSQRPRPPERPRPERELIVGRHPIVEALRAGRRVYRIMMAQEADGPGVEEISRLAAARGIPVERVARARLDSLADHHQGVIADGAPFSYADFDALLERVRSLPAERPPILLAVDALQDPQNFGTLLRTAAAVGAAGVLLPERRSVGVTPAVGRASAGAVEHLAISRVVNLSRALKQLKEAGLWIVGLDAGADQVYDQADLTGPLAIVVGAEGPGLSRLIGETCDLKVRLPLVGAIDALNAAVAGSIVLYEALRQRRAAQRL